MTRTIEELKRKAEQGSQQSQGEVLELELEVLLRGRFPTDLVEPVGKGDGYTRRALIDERHRRI
jgi:hypothetical protein